MLYEVITDHAAAGEQPDGHGAVVARRRGLRRARGSGGHAHFRARVTMCPAM